MYCEMFHFLGQMFGTCLRTRVCVRLDLAMSVWKQLVGKNDSDPENTLETLKEIPFVASLDEEHQRFQQEAENDKQRLQLALEATADKEKKLAEEVEKQRERALELQQQMHQMQLEHAEWKRETKQKLLQMTDAIKRDFLQEQRDMQEKYDYAVHLLRNARDDIVELGQRNEELEKRLQEMILWDKTW